MVLILIVVVVIYGLNILKDKKELNQSVECAEGLITNVSNMPYQNPVYSLINSVGRQWIFEMTLAICKEILGYVRGKYSTVPIPNADMTLNQADLLAAATAEKTALLERLRAYLDETSRANMLERKVREQDAAYKRIGSSSKSNLYRIIWQCSQDREMSLW